MTEVRALVDMEEGEFTLEGLREDHGIPKVANFYMAIGRLREKRYIRRTGRSTYITTPATMLLYSSGRAEDWADLPQQAAPIVNNKPPSKPRPLVSRKVDVLTYYGNGKLACVQCGESRPACLSIDHINGGGNQHKKSISGSMYPWLQREGYPEGYQTLCMNCQWVKRFERGEHGGRGKRNMRQESCG